MPLISNSFTRNSTDFFLNHTPFSVAPTENVIASLSDMYSISVLPSQIPTVINDGIGLAGIYSFTISIKNLTKNIILNAAIDYGQFFIKNNTQASVNILPGQVVDIIIRTDRDKINNHPTVGRFTDNITITITNQDSQDVGVKNTLTSILPQGFLPPEVTIE
jgi:hypothetical protein